MNYKLRIALAILCFILVSLWFNSSSWFRLKLIDYHRGKGQLKKTIQLYNKILRKNSIRKSLSDKILAKICFDLGFLYGSFGLSNLAIESYTCGSRKSTDIAIDSYYQRNDLERDKLIVIGLLESGESKAAINKLQKLTQIYPRFQDAKKYIRVANTLQVMNSTSDNKDFYFRVGDAYIQNELFDEARMFFTKRILDYGIDSIRVLTYLHEKYSENREVAQKVWGDDIYVTLEDFEVLRPRLTQWVSNVKIKVNNHSIVDKIAHRENHSEFLDITSMERGRDLWVKIVNIPLDNISFDLGIRAFIKSTKPSPYNLSFNVKYPECHESGVSSGSAGEEFSGGWREYRIENLGERTSQMALRRNWNTEGRFIDKIILTTQGVSNQFYIDDIELYLVNSGKG